MSSGERLGLEHRNLIQEDEGQTTLVRGCFAFNPSPESILEISLTKNSLIINSHFPTTLSLPNIIPITPDLSYRIITQKAEDSSKLLWLLQLRDNQRKMVFKSLDSSKLDSWSSVMRKNVNKFGFWDDFKPIRRISKGIGAAVYEVARVADGGRFAVKAFPKSYLQQNLRLLEGFDKQIKILRKIGELHHTHLLGIQQVYTSQSTYYVVMELCGRDLLRGGNYPNDDSKQTKVRQAMRQLLNALVTLHENGIVHRDIKPSNIMFKLEHKFQLVIADFGLATRLEEDHPFVRCGTPGFVAPEVFKLQGNEKLSNFAADIFAMGVIFHILLTGEHLFKAQTHQELFMKNRKMEFDLNQETYKRIGQSSMKLLKKMLIIDPLERITAQEALKQEYFIDNGPKIRSPAPTYLSFNAFMNNNQPEFSQIQLEDGANGRKRHKGQFRKASHP